MTDYQTYKLAQVTIKLAALLAILAALHMICETLVKLASYGAL